jgi:hypothetical protein
MSSKSFYTNLVNPNLPYNAGNNGAVANPMTTTLDAGENSIINLPNPSTDGEPVTLAYFNSQLPSLDQSGNYVKNPMEDNLDAANNMIVNTTAVSMKDSVDTLLTYYIQLENGGVVTTNASDDTDSLLHIAINEGGTSKPYYTDFRTFPITNLGSLGFLDGGSISKNSDTFQFNQPLDMNNNYIKDVQNIQFFNAPPLEIDLSNNLVYADSIIVTASNINGYIAQANWEPTASSDLTMSSHNINFTSGNIVMQSGSILLNNTIPLNVDTNNDLNYDYNKVIVCKNRVLGNIPMSDSTPNSAIDIKALTPILLANNSWGTSGIFADPVFDIELTITPQAGSTNIDLSKLELVFQLSDSQNPINSSIVKDYIHYTGGFQKDANGIITCHFKTNVASPYLQIVNSWTTATQDLGGIFFLSVSATNNTSNDTYIQTATAVVNVISTDDAMASNEIIDINNNASLQTCSVSAPIELDSGATTINIFDYSTNTALQTVGSFYASGTIVANNLCLKFSMFIVDNQIVSSSGSQNIIYKDASFESCTFQISHHILQATLTMQGNQTGTCKCKTKIMCPI